MKKTIQILLVVVIFFCLILPFIGGCQTFRDDFLREKITHDGYSYPAGTIFYEVAEKPEIPVLEAVWFWPNGRGATYTWKLPDGNRVPTDSPNVKFISIREMENKLYGGVTVCEPLPTVNLSNITHAVPIDKTNWRALKGIDTIPDKTTTANNKTYKDTLVWKQIEIYYKGDSICIHDYAYSETWSDNPGVSCLALHLPGSICNYNPRQRKAVCNVCGKHIREITEVYKVETPPKPKTEYEQTTERFKD